MHLEPIIDHFGTTYQVEFDRDILWTFKIFAGHREVGRIYCAGVPPVLDLRDIRLRDDVLERESFPAWIWRKIRRRPQPVRSYRSCGIGTAILSRIESLARSEGFLSIEGWISKVDTDRNSDLPNWYRRRGFEVQLVESAGLKVASIRKALGFSIK